MVLEFPRRRGAGTPAGRPPRFEKRDLALEVEQLHDAGDAARNAQWDRLMTLTVQAWCWRDPESLAALGGWLQGLKAMVDREWSS